MRFDTSLRSIVHNEPALDSGFSNCFKNSVNTALPKNRLGLAIENVIARLEQREHVAKQIGLTLRSVFPTWLHSYEKNNFSKRYERRQRDFAKHLVPSKTVQCIRRGQQCPAAKHGSERIKWRIIIIISDRPEGLEREKIRNANH